MNGIVKDLSGVFHALRRSPWFCIMVVLSLTLGIGVNSAVFSVVNSVLLRPLPYPSPQELFIVNNKQSFEQFSESQRQLQRFGDVASFELNRGILAVNGISYRNTWGASVSANLFHTLGVSPMLGRSFLPTEETSGVRVILLSYKLWNARGSDSDIIGTPVSLNSMTYTVIGVMPPQFNYPESANSATEFWTPLEAGRQSGESLNIVVRRFKQVSIDQIRSVITTVRDRSSLDRSPIEVDSLQREVKGDLRLGLFLCWIASTMLLLLSCGTVAGLQLARSARRTRSIAVRLALGASRGRIFRELLLESLMLGVAGGVASLFTLYLCIKVAKLSLSPALVRVETISIDISILVFTAITAMITGLIFGIAPAIQAARSDCAQALRSSVGQAGSLSERRGRIALTVIQTAITVLLLIVSGLFIRTLGQFWSVPLGFRTDHLLTVELDLPLTKYPKPENWSAFTRNARIRLEAIAGVESVGGTNVLPFRGYSSLLLRGQGNEGSTNVQATMITPHFLSTMGIHLRQGRDFLDGDVAAGQSVIIVDQKMAAQFWPHESPLGKRVAWERDREAEVVGVVDSVYQRGFTETPRATVYVPYSQLPSPGITTVLHTSGDPLAVRRAVLDALHELEPESTVYEVMTMDQVVAKKIGLQRMAAVLLSIFAVVALVNAVFGVYSFVAFTVTQRTREIGIRLAIGARRHEAFLFILRQTLSPVFAGVAVGSVIGTVCVGVSKSLLFGIRPTDPLTFLMSGGGLIFAALVAASLAGARAMKINPMTALRQQ